MRLYLSGTEEHDPLDAYHRQEIEKGLEEAHTEKLLDYDEVKAAWMKRMERH